MNITEVHFVDGVLTIKRDDGVGLQANAVVMDSRVELNNEYTDTQLGPRFAAMCGVALNTSVSRIVHSRSDFHIQFGILERTE